MADPVKEARVTGFAHVLAATRYSLAGLARLWREAAFRQELLGGGVMVGLLALLGASVMEWLIFGLLALLVVAMEAVNTAIEVLVDHLSPEWSQFGKDAKDLGSLAVMCALLGHGLLLAHVLLF